MEVRFWQSLSCGYKRRKRLLLGVHSLSGLFAFTALVAARICSHSRSAITRTLRGILHGVRKYLDLPGPCGTVFHHKRYRMWKPNKMQSNFT